ncbi:hypothetical protein BCR41DRAFT_392729 [Lobosporangium transversale]|uniref:Uncharacterized protein n=1 Tax=Lobosporangium transversale TaxID=64571 RepID=A0A1Y2H0Z9_9FUNG|nr:hypothetical protein BCR41DRAFT_392729 [Lobosporangium transversale]ORZ27403.1 hypothetical protein BCR41DRAFT_392729 [Lobosporangium transversale]|eukprot:XP_021885130.1 hypothetical protein BCR41DRAFT_392729 [Lobosporangium transversale]
MTKTEIYSQGVAYLLKLEDCNRGIKEPIAEIGNKLYACKNLLEEVKSHSNLIMVDKYAVDVRKKEYECAKWKAVAMKELCNSIMCHTYQISKLGMTAEFKRKQITEAASAAI